MTTADSSCGRNQITTITIQRSNAGAPEPLKKSVDIILNCSAGQTAIDPGCPPLIPRIVEPGICSLTPSRGGNLVNDQPQRADGSHVIGPFLAGNVIGGSAVWHVEHASRLALFADILAAELKTQLSADQQGPDIQSHQAPNQA